MLIDDNNLHFPAMARQAVVRSNHLLVLGHQAEESSDHSWDTGYSRVYLAARVDSVRCMVAAPGVAHKNHLVDKVAGIEKYGSPSG